MRLLNWTSAPFSTRRLTPLSSPIGPVNHDPGGTKTVPPPALTHAAIASAKARVFNVCPSGTAP